MSHRSKGPLGVQQRLLWEATPTPHTFLQKVPISLWVQAEVFLQQYNTSTSLSACTLPPEHELQVEKTNHNISAREGEEVTLPCRLQGALLPGTHILATWFQVQSSGRDSALLSLHRDGSVEYPRERPAGRLYLRRPSAGDFSLTLSTVQSGDAGLYYCQLQKWQQQGEGEDWALRASGRSGYTRLTTAPPGNAAECRGLIALHGSSPHSPAGATT